MPFSNRLVVVLFLLALAWPAFAQDEEVDDQTSPCEQACIAQEERCYERCPSDEDDDACSDACYSAADACLNRCPE